MIDPTFMFTECFYVDVVTFRLMGEQIKQSIADDQLIEIHGVDQLISDLKRLGQYVKLNYPTQYNPSIYEDVTEETLVTSIICITKFVTKLCEEMPQLQAAYEFVKTHNRVLVAGQ